MYYKVSGKGKVVMLVHGFIEDGRMWDGIAKELSKNYKVIVPDLPGFGSEPLGSAKSLSMELYAGYLHAILVKEKVKKLALLGHSMGGYITLYFAEKYSSMLSGFGLINSHCFEDAPEKKENRKKGIEFVRQHGTAPFVTELYNNIFHESFKTRKLPGGKSGQKLIDDLIANAVHYDPRAVMLANEAMMNRKGKEDVLKNAAVPVLFINGKEDESAPLALTLKQSSFPNIADVHFFSTCKHMCVFERKNETIKAIEQYLVRVC